MSIEHCYEPNSCVVLDLLCFSKFCYISYIDVKEVKEGFVDMKIVGFLLIYQMYICSQDVININLNKFYILLQYIIKKPQPILIFYFFLSKFYFKKGVYHHMENDYN